MTLSKRYLECTYVATALRSLADKPITSGADAKCIEQMRRVMYEAADFIDSMSEDATLLRIEGKLDSLLHRLELDT